MIDLYTWTTPNGRKASIMLEETGLDYTAHPIDISKGEQFSTEFLEIAPNNRIPAIVDTLSDGRTVSVFESGAILVYLAEKTGRFLPTAEPGRSRVMQWLFWQMSGVGPMTGQFYHFASAAPEKLPYAIGRFRMEVRRLLAVMEKELARSPYLGGEYSIADMATYPWIKVGLNHRPAIEAEEPIEIPNIERWLGEVGARAAVVRGMAIP